MTLEAGTQLGPYEIVEPLGAGGMGEVYRARDTKLDREIAIKILPEHLSGDSERVARFQREAKLLASLNHPNIATIYGFEESDDTRFLVMELVGGETLAERLRRGPMPIDEVLEVCKQIGEALEAAHEHGVIHRDLKPANVKIAPDGNVKILDFGLAKAFAGEISATEIAESPTITVEHTRPGVVLGTATYMSPEQARGKPLDKRTDIWSFGCVLYECLTGRRPFGGETTSDVIAKILEHDPDLERLPSNTPLAIRALVRHCLEKDRRQRLRDVGDAALELDEAIATRAWTTSALAAAASPIHYRKRGAVIAASVVVTLVLGAAIGVGLVHLLRPRPPTPLSRVSIPIPAGLKSVESIRVSPDGHTVVWIAREESGHEDARIYTRRLDSFEVRPLPGTEGAEDFAISPDGRWLAFVAPISPATERKQLAKIPVDGGSPPLHVLDWPQEWSSWISSQLCWLPGGDIVVLTGEGGAFTRTPPDGGTSTPLREIIKPESARFVGVSSPLPNGRAVFVDVHEYPQQGGFQLDVGVLELDTARLRVVMTNGSRGAYTPTGHLVFSRGETLLAAPFDIDRLEVVGGTAAFTDGLRTPVSWGDGDYGLSRDGTLIYAPGVRVGFRRRILLVDREGKTETWSRDRRAYYGFLSVSPDGTKLAAMVVSPAGLFEIWTSDIDRPGMRRLVGAADGDCHSPVWSPGGDRLAYTRGGNIEKDGIYWCLADSSDEPERLVKVEQPEISLEPRAWSPDGSKLLVERWISGSQRDILLLTLAPSQPSESTLTPLLAAPCIEPDFSPDGKWISYSSDETGRRQVYVRAFHADGKIGPALPITTAGGENPIWSTDGTAVLYQSKAQLMAVEVSPETAMPLSDPRVVLNFDDLRIHAGFRHAMLPDGRLLLIQKGEEEDDITQVNVVLNWLEELKSRVPVGTNE